MGTQDDRIDAYIAKSPDFARPILERLRKIVHAACPEVEETMKWSFPHFDYHGILCSMASFKEHCAFALWKGSLIVEKRGGEAEKAMGQFGRLVKLSDLPSKKVLTGYINEAMRLNEAGIKSPTKSKPKPHGELIVPEDLERALRTNDQARAVFERFSASHRREYVAWITEAKAEATRTRRLETAVAWMAEGKPRNWKYMNC